MLKNIPIFSKFGFTCSIAFILLALIGRFLFPLGDEPDWIARIPFLKETLMQGYPVWTPYKYFPETINSYYWTWTCSSAASSPFSVWASIPMDDARCYESYRQILMRTLIVLVIHTPIFILITFRRFSFLIINLFSINLKIKSWNDKCNALCITLLFPGFIYLSGVLATEQYVLMISSLLIFIFNAPVLLVPLLFYISYIDIGQFVVVSTFLIILYSYRLSLHFFDLKHVFVLMILIIIFSLSIGTSIFGYLANLPIIGGMASSIEQFYASDLYAMNYANKYPILLRPIMTFLAMCWISAFQLKAFPIYIILGLGFLLMFYKSYLALKIKDSNIEIAFYKEEVISRFGGVLCSVFLIILFVSFAPTYSYSKYYIFTLPFYLYLALLIFGKNKTLAVVLSCTFIMFIFLILMRYI